jgi:methionine sulfoxide reductase heme-binding subunit
VGGGGVNDAPLFWNLARASGLIAYVLLSMTMLLGLSVKTRALGKLVKPANVVDTHRVLSLLALGMIALHGVALVLDPAVEISPLDLAVPGLVGYRPVWVAFGIVAAYLAIAVHASFSLRKKIGAKNWRRLHWLTYALFLSATVHGITAGTDTTEGWALAIYGLLVGSIVGGTAWRALTARAKASAKIASETKQPPAVLQPGRRLGPAALLVVAFVGVAAAGVVANITLLEAARPTEQPIGNLAPLAPQSRADTSTPPQQPSAAKRSTPAVSTRPAQTARPQPPLAGTTTNSSEGGESESEDLPGAEDDD